MNKPKKVPLRRCLGCGESFPKKDLIRIVRTPDQTVALDFRGKMSGRGAYICRNAQCLRKAQKANRISRNLETRRGVQKPRGGDRVGRGGGAHG